MAEYNKLLLVPADMLNEEAEGEAHVGASKFQQGLQEEGSNFVQAQISLPPCSLALDQITHYELNGEWFVDEDSFRAVVKWKTLDEI